jgi:hypothetical protein
MEQDKVESVDLGSFTGEAIHEGLDMYVRLAGTADLTAKQQLDRLLCEVHGQMTRTGGTQVNVDVSGVEFMNSACLKAFVTWVTTVHAMEEGRYQITFLFKPDVWWQRRSLGPIVAISDGVANVRPSEPG